MASMCVCVREDDLAYATDLCKRETCPTELKSPNGTSESTAGFIVRAKGAGDASSPSDIIPYHSETWFEHEKSAHALFS